MGDRASLLQWWISVLSAAVCITLVLQLRSQTNVHEHNVYRERLVDAWQETEEQLKDKSSSSREVICKDKSLAKRDFQPVIIFVAGVEGSGHHGMIPTLRDMGGVQLIRQAEQLLTDFWDPTVSTSTKKITIT